jgi:hypothetical protein
MSRDEILAALKVGYFENNFDGICNSTAAHGEYVDRASFDRLLSALLKAVEQRDGCFEDLAYNEKIFVSMKEDANQELLAILTGGGS